MSNLQHILLVEDEENFGSVLTQFLELHRFKVTWLKDGAQAYSKILSNSDFDCCVLDIMMPQMDGLALGKELKASRPELPFIYLTAKSQKQDIIAGYEQGAMDYITKPFDSELLVYKLRALLNRSNIKEEKREHFEIGTLHYDSSLRMLTGKGLEKRLSPKENAVLLSLVSQMEHVVSREEIISAVWGEDNYFTRRSMDVYMAKIRKYLQADPSIEILSLHAGGYQLTVK